MKARRIRSFPIYGRQSIVSVYRLDVSDFVAKVIHPSGKEVMSARLNRMICLSHVVHGKHRGIEVALKVGRELAASLSKASHMGKVGGQ